MVKQVGSLYLLTVSELDSHDSEEKEKQEREVGRQSTGLAMPLCFVSHSAVLSLDYQGEISASAPLKWYQLAMETVDTQPCLNKETDGQRFGNVTRSPQTTCSGLNRTAEFPWHA